MIVKLNLDTDSEHFPPVTEKLSTPIIPYITLGALQQKNLQLFVKIDLIRNIPCHLRMFYHVVMVC